MSSSETDNPLAPSEAHLRRIRARAHHMWEQDGKPAGQEDAYLERARELDAIETSPAGLLPNPAVAHPDRAPDTPVIDEAKLQENLGEFPGLLTDQGDTMPTPESREIAREFREGER
jgi:hypothetical protein